MFSNLRTKTLPFQPAFVLFDTLDIIPESVTLLCGTDTLLHQMKGDSVCLLDTSGVALRCPKLICTYRTFPFALKKPLYRYDSLAWQRSAYTQVPIEYDFGQSDQNNAAIWETSGLNTSGAYTRGFGLGNNQNLNFNSDLNLQLSGKLGNDIEINAAIADNSVPVQPDGSTRNIQEFDRIYVEVKRKNSKLLAGDFEQFQPAGRYFTRYYKKLQGASASTTAPLHQLAKRAPLTDTVSARVGAAISRGKFNRQFIQGIEGNQGPYRLQGAEGERFIIVLGATEKVYIDGKLMRRGQDDDYVIDYNLGEVTFTARRLITKDIRIIVEFEYVVQQFLRTMLTTEAEWTRGRKRAYVSFYSEQDNPNTSGIQELRLTDRLALASIGDSVTRAFSTGVDTLREGFELNRVLYKWTEIIVCGVPRSVLEFSTNRDSAFLTVRWTEVPSGQGNYNLQTSNANGRVYVFSPPDPVTCQPTGRYEPITKLTAPEQKQILALGTEIVGRKNERFAAEVAVSNRDINRFSTRDDADDLGVGVMLSGRKSQKIGRQQLVFMADYELAQDRFKPINPYRPQEFVRDWNIETQSVMQPRTEHIARTGLTYTPLKDVTLTYLYNRYDRQASYHGNKHITQLQVRRGDLQMFAEMNELSSKGITGLSRFSRPKADISYVFRLRQMFKQHTAQVPPTLPPDQAPTATDRGSRTPVVVGIYLEREKNPRYAALGGNLSPQSFWYDLGRAYIRLPETNRGLSYELSRSRRIDYAPLTDRLKRSTQADEFTLLGQFSPMPNATTHRLTWSVTRRALDVKDTSLVMVRSQTTWLGRADYSFAALRNAISLNTGYEIGSGQNPKLEFTYVRVNPGEGIYTWIDRNQDSVLTVDEMELSVFQDQASYVRLATTTNLFDQTNSLAFNQNLRFEPRLIWSTKRDIRRVLARFSIQTGWQLNRKVKDGALSVRVWNPFDLQVADTSLVNVTASGRQTLFFQRAHPKFESSVSQALLRNRYVATTGFEGRGSDEWQFRLRYNPLSALTCELQSGTRLLSSDAEFFNNRDYRIREYQYLPEVSYLYKRQLRAAMQGRFVFSENSIGFGERMQRRQFTLQSTWQPPMRSKGTQISTGQATSLRAQVSLADIVYAGQANTPVAFVMMEGLQNGKNYLWSLALDRQLSKYMQLSLVYEGRRPGVGRVVHTGRAQMRAVF